MNLTSWHPQVGRIRATSASPFFLASLFASQLEGAVYYVSVNINDHLALHYLSVSVSVATSLAASTAFEVFADGNH